ncbi:MAG: glycoside hydrolase family 13 protein [Saccharofermentanales bacterium]
MEIIHRTRDSYYRTPFGAAASESYVCLAVRINGHSQVNDAYLCYSYGLTGFAGGKCYLLQSPDDPACFRCTVKMPAEACLFFYWFEIITDTAVEYCVKNSGATDNSSAVRGFAPAISHDSSTFGDVFQITVFDKDFHTPDWFKGSVMYQIFPDRFARSSDYTFEKMKGTRDIPDRIYHSDWSDEVDYTGKNSHTYKACDFFGGSIRGIRENLGYVKSLGIDVIYLNPIFESRSNHRYDTGNYEKIDPLLGSDEDFDEFIRECGRLSIRVLLDGVFNHTGADSVYFNKYGTYDTIGAYQDAADSGRSPYYSWYSFNLQHGHISYDSWWGFPDLPNVNENDLHFRDYILGDGGIVKKWLSRGASGWRLDVSDELPDSFLRDIRRSAKSAQPDAVILGEVWEDASSKVSYGHYRDFLLGNTHDCVMGYPFRRAVLGWLSGKFGLEYLVDSLEGIREDYPVQAFLCNMNLIGSHDVARAITELSNNGYVGDRKWQAAAVLTDEERGRGRRLLKLAMLVQFTFPGVASVYYGDEIAMEGYGDPFCRRTIDLENVKDDKPEMLLWLTAMSDFRGKHATLKTGHIGYQASNSNVLVYRRYLDGGRDMAGNEIPDEGIFYVAVNPDSIEKIIMVDDAQVVLGPMHGVIIHRGRRVFEA